MFRHVRAGSLEGTAAEVAIGGSRTWGRIWTIGANYEPGWGIAVRAAVRKIQIAPGTARSNRKQFDAQENPPQDRAPRGQRRSAPVCQRDLLAGPARHGEGARSSRCPSGLPD